MRPTEQLTEEHTTIKSMLQILEKVCQKLDSGIEVNPQHLAQIIEFIKVFADKCHHGKEEDLLFPELEQAGMPRNGGPIGTMLVEHNIGREYVKGMSEAITQYQAGDRSASPRFVDNARSYIALLTQHIDKEDHGLFPAADMRLSKEKQEQLLEGFEKVEQDVIGAGRHEEFEKLLNHLKEVYR